MSLEDEVYEPQVIVFAVFGQNSHLSDSELHESILYPLLEEWGRTPDTILLPTDGKIACAIHEWAESLHIKTKQFHSDWIHHGKIAQVLRDDRMIKECTHALFFLSSRSKRLNDFAEKWFKKGKEVFTWHPENHLERLSHPEKSPEKASGHDHKSNKGTMLTWLKCQMTE